MLQRQLDHCTYKEQNDQQEIQFNYTIKSNNEFFFQPVPTQLLDELNCFMKLTKNLMFGMLETLF